MKTLAAVICCAALLSASLLSIHAQQDPLPPIKPKTVIVDTATAVYAPPSLAEAADHNDYIGFAALYNDMKRRGESVDGYTPLYDLWTWSLSNPTGAFYGAEMHDKLARAYSGFAKSIEPYAIVDSTGTTFWPTSETRDFLLQRARAGQSTRVSIPAPDVAAPAVVPRETPQTEPAPAVTPRARKRVAKDVVVQQPVRTNERASATPPPARPEPQEQAPLAPVKAITPPPAVTATQAAQAPAPAVTPDIAPATPSVSEPLPPAPVPVKNDDTRGGMLLLVGLAILGLVLFLMLMRTPADAKEAKGMDAVTLDEKPPAPVEPIRGRKSGATDVRVIESHGSDESQQHSPSSPDRSRRDGDVLGLRR